MMIGARSLLMMMMLSSNVVLSMDIYWRQSCEIIENMMPAVGIEVIKALAKNDWMLTETLKSKKGTEQVLDFVGEKCPRFWRENAGIGCRDREGFRKELAAAILGTPGAIAFGKEYIQGNDEAKKRLQRFLSNIVRYGHEPSERHDGFTFVNEGVDIIQAALEMGLDPNMLDFGNPLLIIAAQRNKARVVKLLRDYGADKEIKYTEETEYVSGSWDKEPKYTQSYTALYAAVKSDSLDVLDLLIQWEANVNTPDAHGGTPLMLAVASGSVEIVKKLLNVPQLSIASLDKNNKTALVHAKERLLKAKDEDKKNYEIILQLIADVYKKKNHNI
jgi:hypothetical protein